VGEMTNPFELLQAQISVIKREWDATKSARMVAEMELERIKDKEKELEDFCLELMERQKQQTLSERVSSSGNVTPITSLTDSLKEQIQLPKKKTIK
jgi:hypothetical protein